MVSSNTKALVAAVSAAGGVATDITEARMAKAIALLTRPAAAPRIEWAGYSATSVVRALGARGWKPKQVLEAANRAGINISPATIVTQLHAGRKGKGKLATLTDEQVSAL